MDIYAFRFHTGSIKRRVNFNFSAIPKRCFDSILVRLKVSVAFRVRQLLDWFRFHTGSIKRKCINARAPLTFVSIPYWFD